MPQVQALRPSARVWLLTGKGGRDLVVNTLAGRCDLQRFSLYVREKRRVNLPVGFEPKAIWVARSMDATS